MTILCAHCMRVVNPNRAGTHSRNCRPQVLARVAEDRKARPAQYQPIPAPMAAAVEAAVDDLLSAPTQGMLFGEEWTR